MGAAGSAFPTAARPGSVCWVRIGTALAVLLGLSGPATTQAQTERTAIARFGGRRAAAAEGLVRRSLDGETDLISRRDTRRALRRAGVRGLDGEGIIDLCASLSCDVVVQGRVGGSRRRQRVQLVFRASDGSELAREELELARGARARRAFSARLTEAFGRARAERQSRMAPPEPEPELPVFEPEPEPEPEPPSSEHPPVFTAGVGITARNRTATVDLVDGRQRRYDVVYSELALAVEARPLAADDSAARGLFLRASFAHSLGLASEDATGAQIDTNFVRFAADVGYLLGLTEEVELGLALGMTYDGYHFGLNDILPTAEYITLRPALRGRIRLLEETVVLGVELGYRGALGIGPLRDAFGSDGDSHGVDMGVQVGGTLQEVASLGLTWGLRFEYVGQFNSYGGAASDQPATSGEDSAFIFSVLAGWSFQ